MFPYAGEMTVTTTHSPACSSLSPLCEGICALMAARGRCPSLRKGVRSTPEVPAGSPRISLYERVFEFGCDDEECCCPKFPQAHPEVPSTRGCLTCRMCDPSEGWVVKRSSLYARVFDLPHVRPPQMTWRKPLLRNEPPLRRGLTMIGGNTES